MSTERELRDKLRELLGFWSGLYPDGSIVGERADEILALLATARQADAERTTEERDCYKKGLDTLGDLYQERANELIALRARVTTLESAIRVAFARGYIAYDGHAALEAALAPPTPPASGRQEREGVEG